MESLNLKQWDKASSTYKEDQEHSFNSMLNREFIHAQNFNLKSKKVLDAGCGFGDYTNYFVSLGALVDACDGSEEMIKLCKEKNPNVDVKKVNLLKKLSYKDNYFDFIFCNLVLMDIPDTTMFFKEASRMLKPNGKIFFTITHSAFYKGSWVKDKNGKKIARTVENYLKHITIENHFWGKTFNYHRPVSYYANELAKNNFCITKMLEPAPSDKLVKSFKDKDHSFKQNFPIFLCFEATKKED